DELATRGLARVEEGRRGRLEAPGDDLLDHGQRELLVAVGEGEGDHDDSVLEALEVLRAVERLQRVRGVVLEGAEERLEAEVEGVGELPGPLEELRRVALEHLLLVVAVLDEVRQALLD